MHEFSLAQHLMAQLAALLAEHQAERVDEVVVGVGPLSGVVVDSFRFAFEELRLESPRTEEARLVIEPLDPGWRCRDCGHRWREDAAAPPCPGCGGTAASPDDRDDLLLLRVGMHTAAGPKPGEDDDVRKLRL